MTLADERVASSGQATADIADLAEEIVDEISRADRDWPAIERRVQELLELVGRGARAG